MNFPLAVIDACADVIKKSDSPSFILGYRLSPEEIEVPGIRMADTLALIKELNKSQSITSTYHWQMLGRDRLLTVTTNNRCSKKFKKCSLMICH